MAKNSLQDLANNHEDQIEHLDAAIGHVDALLASDDSSVKAVRGILFSLSQTLGNRVGDPNLPEHIQTGYAKLHDVVNLLHAKLGV